MTPQELAQWVIDNRYAKSEFEKVCDQEMYLKIIESFNEYTSSFESDDVYCEYCKYKGTSVDEAPCKKCGDFSNFVRWIHI